MVVVHFVKTKKSDDENDDRRRLDDIRAVISPNLFIVVGVCVQKITHIFQSKKVMDWLENFCDWSIDIA
jgi:hypothetical protein